MRSEDVQAWQARPLDPFYPAVLVDTLHLKLRRERMPNGAQCARRSH
jgi:transposase-like protein